MPTRYKLLVVTVIFILLTVCGSSEPTAVHGPVLQLASGQLIALSEALKSPSEFVIPI